ncbi:MAG: SUMF1/EgtB/PvdO family nonheme iron enzyme [bacterium]
MAFRHISDQTYECPICKKKNSPHETFRCRRCARQYLCVDHLNPQERVCRDCVSIKKDKSDIEPGMVLVHEGDFFMGIDDDGDNLDAAPLHSIRLEQYLIDQNLVSNKEFREFKPGHEYPEGMDDESAVNVTFHEAKEYAQSKGKRLPTEPEWEKAARSRDKRPYPWGKDLPVDAIKAANDDLREGLKKYNLSPYRVRDMSGGVWEWIDSEYEPYPDGNTAIPGYYHGNKAIRGGETGIGKPAETYRRGYAHPMDAREDIGFRCVKGAPQVYEKKYAGAEIKRPKKSDMPDAPPPEFKKFKESKDKTHTLEHIDYQGVTTKDAIKYAQKQVEMGQTIDEGMGRYKTKLTDHSPDLPEKPGESYPPVLAKPAFPLIAALAILAIVVIVVFVIFQAVGGAKKIVEKQRYMPPQTKMVMLSMGNVKGPTQIIAEVGDRINISVQGIISSDPEPPLKVIIGNNPEIHVGKQLTFVSDQSGEIQLIYSGEPVIPPSGIKSFRVEIKIEKKIEE